MADVRKGSFCKSIAGHDKDCCYIIVENNGMLKVCDGKYRKLTNPKVKNIKHLEIIEYRDEELDRAIEQNKLRDENIKYSIKKYLAHLKN